MNKRKIVVIFVDDEVMFLSSYSYLGDYRPKFGDTLDTNRIKICLTNNIEDACKWSNETLLNIAYETLSVCLLKEPDIKSVFRVDRNIFRRYLKIKNLKEKCQKIN